MTAFLIDQLRSSHEELFRDIEITKLSDGIKISDYHAPVHFGSKSQNLHLYEVIEIFF